MYDGECGICSASALWIQSLDTESKFNIIPFQNANFVFFPEGLTIEKAKMSVILLDNNSNIYYIASRAVFEILKNLGGIFRLFGIVGSNSLVSTICNPFYKLIARHRRRISICLGFNACSINYEKASGQK